MIKFFRKIRQQLLPKKKFSKYLLFAIGEISIVILIAWQIINWNSDQKDTVKETKVLEQLMDGMAFDSDTMGIELENVKKAQHSIKRFEELVDSTHHPSGQKFLYNLNFPDHRIELSDKLNEISGMEMLSDSVITAIQDEKAHIFYLDSYSGEIIEQFDFGKNADYEGIAHYKKHFYVLRSDGNIFKVSPKKEAEEYKFKQGKGFDFEGLCLDQLNNRLLVACKMNGIKDKRDHFFIYSFSLESKEYEKKPAFRIKRDEVHKNFKPSAIAIHPNGNLYVLSSFSKTLLVLSANGSILNNIQLSNSIFQQPEGITFNSKGDLFISNEKKETAANILKFKKAHEKN